MDATKKLYIVEVRFSFPVLAPTEDEALDFLDEATRDLYLRDCASARVIRFFKDGTVEAVGVWDSDSLVYGTEEDTTFEEAVETEKTRQHNEETAKKQGNLF